MKDDIGQALFLQLIGGLTVATLVQIIATRLNTRLLPTTAFIQPEIVSDIAASLDGGDEDIFIAKAWDWVSQSIDYKNFGSSMTFMDHHVRCYQCDLPPQVLKTGVGNCVGMSSLLVSILRNRLSAERVFMVIGDYDQRGHAWTEVQRQDGKWYLLEVTRPSGEWVLADSQEDLYVPYAYLNDQHFSCDDPKLCISVSRCDCEQHVSA